MFKSYIRLRNEVFKGTATKNSVFNKTPFKNFYYKFVTRKKFEEFLRVKAISHLVRHSFREK